MNKLDSAYSMYITKRLLELDPTLEIHNEGHWKEPYNESIEGFASFNDAGVECETGEFLYSLVRLLKPSFVLETGTHWGISASYMGLGLQHNKKGLLDTCEFLQPNYEKAVSRINRVGLDDYVHCHLVDVATYNPLNEYDLILLDTEPQTRFNELVKFFPALKQGGFILIHDLHRHMHQLPQLKDNPDHPGLPYWPYGPIPEQMKHLIFTDQLRPFHFTTPRGLTGFYKVSSEDYHWEA